MKYVRKTDNFGQDILSLLEKNEPDMLMWREIKNRLWPKYKDRYKNVKTFGVALSNKLTRLAAKKKIKHEDDLWGTTSSSISRDEHTSKEHMITIFSGFRSLCAENEWWDQMDEMPRPSFEYEGFALQHLESYPEIYARLPSLVAVCRFPQTEESRQKFKAMDFYFKIKATTHGLRRALTRRFKEKDLAFPEEYVNLIIDRVLSLRPPFKELKSIPYEIRVEKPGLWSVEWQSHILCSVNTQEEAEDAKDRARTALRGFLKKEGTRLLKAHGMIDDLSNLEREFCCKVKLLVLRLLNRTEELRGKCDVCARSEV